MDRGWGVLKIRQFSWTIFIVPYRMRTWTRTVNSVGKQRRCKLKKYGTSSFLFVSEIVVAELILVDITLPTYNMKKNYALVKI